MSRSAMREEDGTMRLFIHDIIEVGKDVWADLPNRIAVLFVIGMALSILIGLILTNPPVDWSQ
jgi:hypothetical protein